MTTDTKDNLQHFATVALSRPVLTVSSSCSAMQHYQLMSRPVSAQCEFILFLIINVTMCLLFLVETMTHFLCIL